MDFTLYGTIVIIHEFDSELGTVKMTFKNEDETVEIGSMTIEQNRYRSFVESIGLHGKLYFGDLAPNVVGYRADLNKLTNKTTVTFG